MRRHMFGFGLAAGVVLAAAGGDARGQKKEATFDRALFERETAKIAKLGKSALPVYSLDAAKAGSFSYEDGKLTGKDGAVYYLAPIGWAANSSLTLGDRINGYVLVVVGPPVRVGDVTLKTGEYAAVRDGKLVKVTAADLKK